jgi:hypothetical protein
LKVLLAVESDALGLHLAVLDFNLRREKKGTAVRVTLEGEQEMRWEGIALQVELRTAECCG